MQHPEIKKYISMLMPMLVISFGFALLAQQSPFAMIESALAQEPCIPAGIIDDSCDQDKDGVLDQDDQCVLEPGPASNNGCPIIATTPPPPPPATTPPPPPPATTPPPPPPPATTPPPPPATTPPPPPATTPPPPPPATTPPPPPPATTPPTVEPSPEVQAPEDTTSNNVFTVSQFDSVLINFKDATDGIWVLPEIKETQPPALSPEEQQAIQNQLKGSSTYLIAELLEKLQQTSNRINNSIGQ